MRVRQTLRWTGSKTQDAFIKVFPKSAPVFAKRDMLTGLNHGPSSYFLKSIGKKTSSGQTPTKKRCLPENKNMI